MNEQAQPGDAPETIFRVNKGLGSFVMMTAVLCESTYRESGADHAPPAFLVRNGTDLGAIYYEGEGASIDAFREETFATKLGTGAEQYEAMVFFSEAWVRTQFSGEAMPATRQGDESRRECVIYEARDVRGNVVKARQFIDRSGERPRLDDFTFIEPGVAHYLPSVWED